MWTGKIPKDLVNYGFLSELCLRKVLQGIFQKNQKAKQQNGIEAESHYRPSPRAKPSSCLTASSRGFFYLMKYNCIKF
jgi:hypothetical protein